MDNLFAKLITDLEALLSGDKEPESLHEDLFLRAYHSSLQDIPLFTLIVETQEFNLLTAIELVAFITGYALGQQQLNELENQLPTTDTETYH